MNILNFFIVILLKKKLRNKYKNKKTLPTVLNGGEGDISVNPNTPNLLESKLNIKIPSLFLEEADA